MCPFEHLSVTRLYRYFRQGTVDPAIGQGVLEWSRRQITHEKRR
jgi:hypothetical protein